MLTPTLSPELNSKSSPELGPKLTVEALVAALFQELRQAGDRTTELTQLGPWLAQQMPRCIFPKLHHLPLQTAAYTRNAIAPEIAPEQRQPWQGEAFLLRWDRQAKTRIHGHPAFSFYHVISGRFEMEYFTPTPQGLKRTEIRHYPAGETTWCLGQAGRYDNFIHRVTCLEPGLTFHVYSEDAKKGLCWETAINQVA